MSMISAQIDELRELAGDGSMEWVTGPIRASVLRDAANTIWQLRDDLQRTNAENAKLREQTELLVTLLRNDCDIEASWDGLRKFWYIGLTESGCLMRDRVCKAEAENAKLRELVEDMLDCIEIRAAWHRPPTEKMCEEFARRARELGIEVD